MQTPEVEQARLTIYAMLRQAETWGWPDVEIEEVRLDSETLSMPSTVVGGEAVIEASGVAMTWQGRMYIEVACELTNATQDERR